VACTLDWTRPTLLPSSEQSIIRAQALRHPVVEASLQSSSAYIPNDVALTNLAIITGPNCGGKSTYIR
jgi:DNA mismatch repair ATPase MutS